MKWSLPAFPLLLALLLVPVACSDSSPAGPVDENPVGDPPGDPDPDADPEPDPDPDPDPDPEPFELVFDEGSAAGWFGGDDRPGQAPRHVGVAQSVLVEEAIQLEAFSFSFTKPFESYATSPVSPQAVTVVLNVRDEGGVILGTAEADVPESFEGGWVRWDGLNLGVPESTTLIFSAYVRGALDTHPFHSSAAADAGGGYAGGSRFMKEGTSDADMESWTGWSPHPWSAHFRIEGTIGS